MRVLSQARKNSLLTRPFWICLILSVIITFGCAGPAQQVQSAQVAAQLKAQTQKNALQEQLLAQAGRDTLTGYRDYVVGPEDLLVVNFLGVDGLNRETRVNGQGEISLPLVGAVHVEGLTTQKIEERLRQKYQKEEFLNNPQISVEVKDYRHQRVMVTGAVVQPGAHEMIGPRTLLEMLGKAGGLKENAGEVVYIIRAQSAPEVRKSLKQAPMQSFAPGSETTVIDMRRLLAGGAQELNMPIRRGDVINVPFAESAYVLGAVIKPCNVILKNNLSATQAVAMAGGLHTLLASNKVTIVRMNELGKATTIPLDLGRVTKGEEADIPLKVGDIVYVEENIVRRMLFDFRSLVPVSPSMGFPGL